jgi:hypothetical protein
MSTVVTRKFRSNPHRDAHTTWQAIVDLLTKERTSPARTELLSVSGIGAAVIADQAPRQAAIIVTCDGPRTRVYCTYDEDAIDGTDANEDTLGFDPLSGDWAMSLPCQPEDLPWVQDALKKFSSRITARDLDASISLKEAESSTSEALVLDPKGFLGA